MGFFEKAEVPGGHNKPKKQEIDPAPVSGLDNIDEIDDILKREKFTELRGLERHIENKSSVAYRLRDILEEADIDVVVDDSEAERGIESQIKFLIEEIGGTEAVDEMRSEGFSTLREYMKDRHKIIAKLDKLKGLRRQLIHKANEVHEGLHKEKTDSLKDSVDFWHIVKKFDAQIDALEDSLLTFAETSPEGFIASQILELREYKEQLQESGIVETPYVKEKIRDIEEVLVKNGLTALVGETGTGKTRIAEKIAKQLTNQDPLWVYGHGQMSKEDLLYHLGIIPETEEAKDTPTLIREAKKLFEERNPDIKGKERDEALRQIEEVLKGQMMGKTMATEVVAGPVLQAAEEGRIVIIDEFNYIKPQLLAGLNALSEAKPGRKVEFMGKEIVVKEGFGIIFSGNISKADFQRYKDRSELDPAFINRLNSGLIEYNTPPQDIKHNFTELINGKGEEIDKDLFLIALAHLVDAKGNLKAKTDTLDEAWRLSRSFSIMQKIFSGENIREGIDAEDISGTAFNMKKYHASLRTFGDILRDWKRDSFEVSIDWYIYNNLIRPSYIVAPNETAQMFYILQKSYGDFFNNSPVWKNVKVDTTSWTISGLDNLDREIHPEEDLSDDQEIKLYQPKELAEIMAGREAPKGGKRQSVKARESDQQRERVENIADYEEKIRKARGELREYSDTADRFCNDEEKIMSV